MFFYAIWRAISEVYSPNVCNFMRFGEQYRKFTLQINVFLFDLESNVGKSIHVSRCLKIDGGSTNKTLKKLKRAD